MIVGILLVAGMAALAFFIIWRARRNLPGEAHPLASVDRGVSPHFRHPGRFGPRKGF
jgi:hypothetical protein